MSDDLVKRLRDPAFGTETTERNLMDKSADRIEELEAKLEKAVEALAWCSIYEESEVATTTIAELKGETDE